MSRSFQIVLYLQENDFGRLFTIERVKPEYGQIRGCENMK